MNNKWDPYVKETYADGLGRWASATLKRNQTRRLTVIAAYRFNRVKGTEATQYGTNSMFIIVGN